MENKLKSISKIYILESPSKDDLLSDNIEGKALSEILKICNINFDYYLVKSTEEFKDIVDEIKDDVISLQEENMVFPIIHISCHGSRDGIELTDGDFINWVNLKEILDYLNILFEDEGINLILLSMSTCYGLNAIKADWNLEGSPFAFVLGHEEEIRWDDGAIAFSSFYHNAINKNLSYDDALICMNYSINQKNHFKLFNSKDIYSFYSEHQIP